MADRPRRVVWTRHARDGQDAVIEYISQESPEASAKILDLVLESASSLNSLSMRGRIVPELQDPTVRETFIYSYRLLYQVTEEEVRVLAILHGARDFDRWIPPAESE